MVGGAQQQELSQCLPGKRRRCYSRCMWQATSLLTLGSWPLLIHCLQAVKIIEGPDARSEWEDVSYC